MFIFLRRFLHKDNADLVEFDSEVGAFIFKILASSTVMGLIGYGAIYVFAPLVNTHTTFGIIIQSGLSVTSALLAFVWVSFKLKVPQTSRVMGLISRIFFS
jgi:hypothetical protein